jgi:hypothetical protein
MKQSLNSEAAYDLVTRTVTTLAGKDAAAKVAPSLKAAFELVRETATASSSGKREPVITSVRVSVGGSDGGSHQPETTVIAKGAPIDSGPKKRVPIRVGGGSCFTIKSDKVTVTICIDWESP